MRITFLNLASDAGWGGGERWTLYTAKGLMDRGHNVMVVGRSGSMMTVGAFELSLPTRSVPAGIDYSPLTIACLLSLLRRERPNILVVHHNKDVRTGGVAAKLCGIRVVHRNGFPIIHNNWRHRLTQRFVDRILTNARRIRDRYLDYGWIEGNLIDVVPNGIKIPDNFPGREEIRRSWGVTDNDLVAYYAGRVTKVKRVHDLIEAWRLLPEHSNWRLVIAGEGSELESLKSMTHNYGLDGHIRFLGFLKKANLSAVAADLAVLPSADEGMPNALMEAMVCGVPVAATPVGDVPELLNDGDAGWLLPVSDRESWTELLTLLEERPEELKEMGVKGEDRVKNYFTFERMIDGVEASLRRALE